MRTSIHPLRDNLVLALCGCLALASWPSPLVAQDAPAGTHYDSSVAPVQYSTFGGFYSQPLGTALRFNYHTKGYGTEDGVVSLGAMKVFDLDGATWFLDGQGTLSDDFGGGFNAGIGYRELGDIGFGPDSRRINGIGFWTDGQSTSADNFFTQLGFSLESLGDSYDLRLNGQFPLDRTLTSESALIASGTPMFLGDALVTDVQSFAVDTALTVIDGEVAKRIGDFEAWAFAGSYWMDGGSVDDVGYRAGVRGYAVPDLALSLQLTDDNIYQTNVMFGVTWFIGRTNARNQPCGTIEDRFREPVLRNDFVATTQRTEVTPGGDPLTDAATGDQLVFVHVDSEATDPGDGSVELPYMTLAEAEIGSTPDDIVFVHSGSTYTDDILLQENQQFLGEGLDADGVAVVHFVDTTQLGLVALPESSPGASTGVAPIINSLAGATAITLGNNNRVNNFTINGGETAVAALAADVVFGPTLGNLRLNNQTGNALSFEEVTSTTTVENTVLITDAEGSAVFIDGGDGGMNIAAEISNSTASGSVAVVQNRTVGNVAFSGTIDATAGMGILVKDNTDSTVDFTNTVTLSTGNNVAVLVEDNLGSTITFSDLSATAVDANTVEVKGGGTVNFNTNADDSNTIANTGTGNAFDNISGISANDATISISQSIANSGTGNAVNIQDRLENDVTVTGPVSSTSGGGIFIMDNSAGLFTFTGEVDLDASAGNTALSVFNNTGATISFLDLNITSVNGQGVSATGGGTLTITNPNATNTIESTGAGTAVQILGDIETNISADIISSGTGRSIDIGGRTADNVTINGTVDDSGAGVRVEGNTGGTVTLISSMTLNTGTNDAVTIDNNTGTTIAITGGMDIDTTSGRGFFADSTDTLSVTGTNTIDTTTGTGLTITNTTLDPANITFASVSVDGATNGIDLQNLDGAGTVLIGSGFNAGDGGTLTGTTGNAINIANADNVFIDAVLIDNSASAGNGVVITNGAGESATLSDMDITTSIGKGFSSTVGGTLAVTGTNSITTTTGTGLELVDTTIGATDVTFDSVSVNGATNGILLQNLDGAGGVVVGTGTTAGDGGTLTSTTGDAISITDADDVNINHVTIDNSASAGNGVVVANSAGDTATFGGLNVTTNAGHGVSATGDGTLTINDPNATNTIESTGAGTAVRVFDDVATNITADITSSGTGRSIDIGNRTANNVTINGTVNDTAAGVRVMNNTGGTVTLNSSMTLNTGTNDAVTVDTNTGTTIAFTGGMDIDTTSGRGFFADSTDTLTVIGTNTIDTTTGTGLTITNTTIGAADITFDSVSVNGATNGILLQNVDGAGEVTVGSGTNPGDGGTLTNTTGDAISITDADDVNINHVTIDNSASAGNGVVVANSAGDTATFDGLNVTTDSGNGFSVTGGGTLVATGSNNVTTDEGVALEIKDQIIGAGGVNFDTVNVTSGAGVGIELENLTSNTVRIGSSSATGTDGAGGTLTTASSSILVTNVTSAVFNDMTVDAAAGDAVSINHTSGLQDITFDNLTVSGAGATGVAATANSTGEFDLRIENSVIGSVGTRGVTLNTGPNSNRIDLTIRGSSITAGDDHALMAQLDDPGGDVRFLLEGGNTFTNNSVASATVEVLVQSDLTLSATIGSQGVGAPLGDSNDFTNNNGGGTAFAMEVDSAAGVIDLDLRDNTASGGAVDYILTETNGTFGVVDLANTVTADTNNVGAVDVSPNVAAFDDLAPPIDQVTP